MVGSIHGISNLTQVGNPIPASILSHPAIELVTLGATWGEVQPTNATTFDFSYYANLLGTGQIQLAVAAGKRCIVGVGTGGGFVSGRDSLTGNPTHGNIPDWVATEMGVAANGIVDVPGKVFVQADGPCNPCFWQANFHARRKALIQAFANFLFTTGPLTAEEKNAIVGLRMGIFNANTDDWNIPSKPADVAKWLSVHGYSTFTMRDTALDMVATMASSFPNRYLILSMGNTKNNLDAAASAWGGIYAADIAFALANKIADDAWAANGRFITAQNSLTAHLTTDQSAFQQRIYDAGRLTGGQSTGAVLGDANWSMCNVNETNEDPDNAGQYLTPDQILRKAFLKCRSFINCYYENYQLDGVNLPEATAYGYSLYHEPLAAAHISRS